MPPVGSVLPCLTLKPRLCARAISTYRLAHSKLQTSIPWMESNIWKGGPQSWHCSSKESGTLYGKGFGLRLRGDGSKDREIVAAGRWSSPGALSLIVVNLGLLVLSLLDRLGSSVFKTVPFDVLGLKHYNYEKSRNTKDVRLMNYLNFEEEIVDSSGPTFDDARWFDEATKLWIGWPFRYTKGQ